MANKKTKRKNRIVSLRFKSIAIILVFAIVLSVIAITISYNVYSNTMDEQYKRLSSNLAKTAASQLSAEDLERYYEEVKKIGTYDDEKYWGDEAYKAAYDAKADAIKDAKYYEMLDTLFEIKDNNDILYLYVQKLDGDMCTYIFDADRADDRCQLGTTHEVSGPTKETKNPENGIPAFITNDAYGWLVTSMEPVKDADGNPVALVGVDISMDDIMAQRANYLRNIIIITIEVVRLSSIADRKNVMNAMRHNSFRLLRVCIVSRTKLNPPFWSTSSTIVIAPIKKNRVVDVLPKCRSITAFMSPVAAVR